ncbi:MAG: lipoyl(octanoyl) transferase LipB [Desulfobacterales bacterium]|nr:MAG: lipoyl(octanoyl) transferase LipB [Desulfobacterales bacterium]
MTQTPEKSYPNVVSAAHSAGMASTRAERRRTAPLRTWLAVDLGTLAYQKAWDLQIRLVNAKKAKAIAEDVILFLEHPAVFTLGRRGGCENLLVTAKFLAKADIAVIQVERGGDITFHGPGQLVVYPIVDLPRSRLKVVDFVDTLEEIMIRTARNWGIPAQRDARNRGIWVGDNKMGSIGIAVRRGISFHGLALNVSLDLSPFAWIQPCGLQGVGMTSMQRELSRALSVAQVREEVRRQFEAVLGVKLQDKSLFELQTNLHEIPDKIDNND